MAKHNLFSRAIKKTLWLGVFFWFWWIFTPWSQATDVKKLFDQLQVGQRIRVKIIKTTQGELVADRIQLDQGTSKPKIRGSIQKIDQTEKTLEIMGLKIKIKETTETDLKKTVNPMEVLKPGQRVEVKIRVQDDSTLKATRLTTQKIKASDKIEASIEEKIKDGKDYFYLKLLGLKIKINSGTDVLEEISENDSVFEIRLVDMDETESTEQIKFGNFLIVEDGIE